MVAFIIGDISARIMGLAYNGKDKKGNSKWDSVEAVNSIVEFKWSIQGISKHWNCSISAWLKNYVYLRVIHGENGKKRVLLASALTFLVS